MIVEVRLALEQQATIPDLGAAPMATSYSINVGLGRDPYLTRVGNNGAGDRDACGCALSMESSAL
jgi:hypothetical protein